ncbi:carbon monoxide dehydrogenase [Rhodospirillum rubrum]|uniref:CoxG family protein n=1 Tax=Rhodospirillum rubrum TaxID=1085 RepID=UPI0019065581|nr:carbon monoxide dehydrogenase subunit G [Rhodospirillum rubrum]MBK1664723.1 carbon monoxide dehydrogenase [Rhodospirillum rubrum]MBK1676353.1 carbon monoxide dehydrogenase [Rhodospirillum rubrum]
MDFTGTYRIPAPRNQVWRGLMDPDILKQCIDGCEDLERTSETTFSGKVKVKVGPVSARFAGTVDMEDSDPPQGCLLVIRGQGGVAGFVKGKARVDLAADGEETVLDYSADAEVGGKLASVGARLVRGVADKTAADFFARFSALVGGAPLTEAAPAAEDRTISAFAEEAVALPPNPLSTAPADLVSEPSAPSRLPSWRFLIWAAIAAAVLLVVVALQGQG